MEKSEINLRNFGCGPLAITLTTYLFRIGNSVVRELQFKKFDNQQATFCRKVCGCFFSDRLDNRNKSFGCFDFWSCYYWPPWWKWIWGKSNEAFLHLMSTWFIIMHNIRDFEKSSTKPKIEGLCTYLVQLGSQIHIWLVESTYPKNRFLEPYHSLRLPRSDRS